MRCVRRAAGQSGESGPVCAGAVECARGVGYGAAGGARGVVWWGQPGGVSCCDAGAQRCGAVAVLCAVCCREGEYLATFAGGVCCAAAVVA